MICPLALVSCDLYPCISGLWSVPLHWWVVICPLALVGCDLSPCSGELWSVPLHWWVVICPLALVSCDLSPCIGELFLGAMLVCFMQDEMWHKLFWTQTDTPHISLQSTVCVYTQGSFSYPLLKILYVVLHWKSNIFNLTFCDNVSTAYRIWDWQICFLDASERLFSVDLCTFVIISIIIKGLSCNMTVLL